MSSASDASPAKPTIEEKSGAAEEVTRKVADLAVDQGARPMAAGGDNPFMKNLPLFGGLAAVPKKKQHRDNDEEGGEEEGGEVEPSEDVHFEPIVKLEEVKITTGEDDEDVVFKCRAKLFRFDGPSKEWKERGTGDLKLLRHRQNQRIRVLMRREHTLKICANHVAAPEIDLKPNVGSDKSWVYNVLDYAELPAALETFAVRFQSKDVALDFKQQFLAAQKSNQLVMHPSTAPADDAVDANGDDVDGDNDDGASDVDDAEVKKESKEMTAQEAAKEQEPHAKTE
jgi:Ran-binding protein 1